MSVRILCNQKVIKQLDPNTIATIECGGKLMPGDLTVEFRKRGIIKYLDINTTISANKSVTIPCKGKKLPDNVTVYAPVAFYHQFAARGEVSLLTVNNENFLVRED